MPPGGTKQPPCILQQLHWLLIYTHHRLLRIVRARITIQHNLRLGYKLSVLLCRNHPLLDVPLGSAIFFDTIQTVSWLIEETILSSTI